MNEMQDMTRRIDMRTKAELLAEIERLRAKLGTNAERLREWLKTDGQWFSTIGVRTKMDELEQPEGPGGEK